MCRTPPLPLPKPGHRPPTITYPEDELIEHYYRKHPEVCVCVCVCVCVWWWWWW